MGHKLGHNNPSNPHYTADILNGDAVSVAEAKHHLRVDIADDDALIDVLRVAAREQAETYMQKAVPLQTVVAKFDSFMHLELPVGNAVSITSIQYLDADGVTQTLDPSPAIYLLSGDKVYLKNSETWPETLNQKDAVTVTYTAGWEVDRQASPPVNDVPARIRQAILLIIGDLYENREAKIVGTIVADNKAVEALLYPLRRLGL